MKMIIEFKYSGLKVSYEEIDWECLNEVLSFYGSHEVKDNIKRILIIGENANENK